MRGHIVAALITWGFGICCAVLPMAGETTMASSIPAYSLTDLPRHLRRNQGIGGVTVASKDSMT